MIGSTEQKIISGGERKRTSIGVELITDPSVILLDEPTSGLDSFKATRIVKLLNRLARNEGKTVIATIH
jgi:ABC-type multidrug transport system ATPase subunit